MQKASPNSMARLKLKPSDDGDREASDYGNHHTLIDYAISVQQNIVCRQRSQAPTTN